MMSSERVLKLLDKKNAQRIENGQRILNFLQRQLNCLLKKIKAK